MDEKDERKSPPFLSWIFDSAGIEEPHIRSFFILYYLVSLYIRFRFSQKSTNRYSWKFAYLESFKLRNLTENKEFNNKITPLYEKEGN